MGFFKKIGKAIKKNVSFKNLVKIATPIMGAIPIVGGYVQNISEGLQASHQAKKDAEAQNNAQAAYDAQVQQQQVLNYGSQMVGAVANAGSSMFGNAVMKGVNDGLSNGIVQGSGQIGATVLTSTLKVWFQKNWKIIAGAVAGLIAVIWFVTRNKTGARKRR